MSLSIALILRVSPRGIEFSFKFFKMIFVHLSPKGVELSFKSPYFIHVNSKLASEIE
jgi:hypothetical protein